MSRLEEVFTDGEVLKSDSLNRIVDAINNLNDSRITLTEEEYKALEEIDESKYYFIYEDE